MSKESRVDADHVRVTSDDGSRSYLYEVDAIGPRVCVEVADHHHDGTTTAYEYSPGVLDDRGERKS